MHTACKVRAVSRSAAPDCVVFVFENVSDGCTRCKVRHMFSNTPVQSAERQAAVRLPVETLADNWEHERHFVQDTQRKTWKR